MCFTEFSGLQTEASRLNLCDNNVFYGVCGAAPGLNVCDSHVFSWLRREASGLDMSETQPLQDSPPPSRVSLSITFGYQPKASGKDPDLAAGPRAAAGGGKSAGVQRPHHTCIWLYLFPGSGFSRYYLALFCR